MCIRDSQGTGATNGASQVLSQYCDGKIEQMRVKVRALRPQTLVMYHRRMLWMADWPTSRGRPATASHLLMVINDSTDDRTRKETITVA